MAGSTTFEEEQIPESVLEGPDGMRDAARFGKMCALTTTVKMLFQGLGEAIGGFFRGLLILQSSRFTEERLHTPFPVLPMVNTCSLRSLVIIRKLTLVYCCQATADLTQISPSWD